MKRIESIVLIDDDPIDAFIGKKILEDIGVTDIMIFDEATKALDYLIESNRLPDLLLVDIYMPLINGFEFIEIYKKSKSIANPSNICLISVSLYPQDRSLAKELNIPFVEKPLTKAKLLEIL